MKRFWLGCVGLAAMAAAVVACGGSDGGSESGPGTSSSDPSPAPPSSPRPGTEADGVDVGPEGGSVTANGVTVEVPAGALDAHVTIAVTKEATRPEGYAIDGEVLRFSPEGLHFAKPITVLFPAGAEGHGVHWTLDGDSAHFEPLETTTEGARVVAHPTHFSGGFVGAGVTGVTCISKRRVVTSAGGGLFSCTQTTTIENGVKFWFAGSLDDRERQIASSSPGMAAYTNSPVGTGYWTATDETRVKYTGYTASREYIDRNGAVIDVHEQAARGGTLVHGCETVPLIEVSCTGTTTIAQIAPPPPPPPVDAGTDAASPPVDAGTDAAPPPPVDAGTDAAPPPPPTGVTCIYKRRSQDSFDGDKWTCSQTTYVENNVKLWRVSNGSDPEYGIASNSEGMHLYTLQTPGAAYWITKDATHTRYNGYTASSEYILRTGSVIEVHEKAGRGGAVVRGCESVPLIAVECTGTTTLVFGP